jgi:hypothetical protein
MGRKLRLKIFEGKPMVFSEAYAPQTPSFNGEDKEEGILREQFTFIRFPL